MVTSSIPLDSPVRIAAKAELCQWLADRTVAALSVLSDIEDDRLLEGNDEEPKRQVVRAALVAQLRTDSEQFAANLAELAKALSGQADRLAGI
jgi:hypothetical protein